MKRARDGTVSDLPPYGLVMLEDGERIIAITPGGGGYGPPSEREVERVRRDVLEGWITAERAREVYGVALTDDLGIDEEGTHRLRDELRHRGSSPS